MDLVGGECEKSEKTKLSMLFFVQGGAGDVLAHTPMIRYWRKKHPQDELVVLSTYAHLWENNPYVDTIIKLAEPDDIYSQYKDRLRFFKKHFIYDHIFDVPGLRSTTLPEFICHVYDAEYDGLPLDYFPSAKEIKIAKFFMSQFKKPVILLHLLGAIPSETAQPQKVHNLKDIRFADLKPVIEKYKDRYDFVQIGLAGEPLIDGAIKGFGMPMREAAAVVPQCRTFVFIESFFAHLASAVRKRGVTVFNNTNPDFFGYPSNINVSYANDCPNWPCNRPLGAIMDIQPGYFDALTRARMLWTCPNQRCAVTPPEMLMEALEAALMLPEKQEIVSQQPMMTLAEARNVGA